MQHVRSKERAERTFEGADRIRIEIKPGDNWISVKDLEHLKQKSEGFKHYLGKKRFVIEEGDKAVRPETEKEKSFREKMMDKAKGIAGMIQKKEVSEASQAPDDLKKQVESELSGFKNSLREESVAVEKYFVEVIKKATEEGRADFVQSVAKFRDEYEPSFVKAFTGIAVEVQQKAVKDFEPDLSNLNSQIDDKTTAAVERFSAKLDSVIDKKLSVFIKKLNAAVAKAEKAAK